MEYVGLEVIEQSIGKRLSYTELLGAQSMNRSKKAVAVFMLLVSVLFWIKPVFADESQMFFQGGQQQFDLFVNCQPMNLVVEPLNPGAMMIGLTNRDIAMAAESRLRSARLYAYDRASSRLHIIVAVTGMAFSIVLTFEKILHDNITKLDGFASTWVQGFTGTHGRIKAYVLSALSSQMDEFLFEYRRVNERACEKNRKR